MSFRRQLPHQNPDNRNTNLQTKRNLLEIENKPYARQHIKSILWPRNTGEWTLLMEEPRVYHWKCTFKCRIFFMPLASFRLIFFALPIGKAPVVHKCILPSPSLRWLYLLLSALGHLCHHHKGAVAQTF